MIIDQCVPSPHSSLVSESIRIIPCPTQHHQLIIIVFHICVSLRSSIRSLPAQDSIIYIIHYFGGNIGTPDAVLAINTPNAIADNVPQIFAKKTTIPMDHLRDNFVFV